LPSWRFEDLRARYQALLRRTDEAPGLEDEVRSRLAALTQLEQAARAARTIEEILDESHRRDEDVAQVGRRLAAGERTRARAFAAIGLIQPSARKVDGRKVYALIAADGSTAAYLDIPPGVDPRPHVARRVGIRGSVHYNEALGARLISVRDLESLEARR
jgi:hypothetical protein